MITSRITSNGRTTIPQPVRAALRLNPGDEIAYAIEGDRVILTKAPAAAVEDPFTTFGEWASDNDRRAYDKLRGLEYREAALSACRAAGAAARPAPGSPPPCGRRRDWAKLSEEATFRGADRCEFWR
ncbi:MAG TPA: type II toxin-antitoxin system PrlF family antitoxin [Stellaceae bacterium]|nr:type II toxin-antitoxin system PrlF family antitoxin [Stellaceae bacterium]